MTRNSPPPTDRSTPTASRPPYRRRRRGAACLLPVAVFISAFLLAGCGNDGESSAPPPAPTLESQFPNLARYAGWTEQRFENYLNGPARSEVGATLGATGSNFDLTQENIRSMSLGAMIDTQNSQFNQVPIFDIGLLTQASLTNLFDTSGSGGSTELGMVSNQTATSSSYRNDVDVSASYSQNFGLWGMKASARYKQDWAKQQATSAGSVNLSMSSTNSNYHLRLVTSSLGQGNYYDLRPYLTGPELTAKQIATYVSAKTLKGAAGTYISDVTIVGNGVYGNSGPYANIQLLAAMENLFLQARTQFLAYQAAPKTCTTCPAIAAKITTNMMELKMAIVYAIEAFYSFYGDSFASTLQVMNQALATGQLTSSSSASNSESDYGASLSASVSVFGKIGASTSDSVNFYKQNGYADAMSTMQINASSEPGNFVDTTQWANQIYSMLKAASGTITVPPITVPVPASVTPPAPAEIAKNPADPPDSCFKGYNQWKTYQADKKADAGNPAANQPGQDANAANEIEMQVFNQNGQNGLLPANQFDLPGSGELGSSPDFHRALMEELTRLREMKQQRGQKALGASTVNANNIVQVPTMFCTGFEATPYAAVIPELRPQLDIPGASQKAGTYPNILRIMMTMNQMGSLRSYLGFLSNYSVSQVTSDMTGKFENFYNSYYGQSFSLVDTFAATGKDIPASSMTSFATQIYGTKADHSDGELCTTLGDSSFCAYVLEMLEKDAKAVWMSAPGGYIPFGYDSSGRLGLYSVDKVAIAYQVGGIALPIILREWPLVEASFVPVETPSVNPMSLYALAGHTVQSPLYPIFIYNGSLDPVLVFLQNVGSFQIVYGYQNSYIPVVGLPVGSVYTGPSVTTFDNIDPANPTWAGLHQSVADPGNSFVNGVNNRNPLSWDYYLEWPNVAAADFKKYNVLTVDLGNAGTRTSFVPTQQNTSYTYDPYNEFYSAFSNSHSVFDATMTPVNLATVFPNSYGQMLLLPVNTTTSGSGYPQYTANLTATDIVREPATVSDDKGNTTEEAGSFDHIYRRTLMSVNTDCSNNNPICDTTATQ